MKSIPNKENCELYKFLVTNAEMQKKYDKAMKNSKNLKSNYITLKSAKDYLFTSHLRGNVDTKKIEQAYNEKNDLLLHQLLQEKFLQLFPQSDYQFILKMFKFNQWSWQDLINEFDAQESKCDVLQIISCKNKQINK